MEMRGRLLAVGLAAAAAVAGAGATSDGQPSAGRQTATAVFDQRLPGRSAAVALAIDYVNPDDAGGKPHAVRRVVNELPPGTTIDTSVPERCGASDAQLMASGPAACPAGSRVGGGEVVLDTGNPGPARLYENNVTLLNGQDQLILLLESKSEPPNRFVSRAAVDGTRVVSEVPPVPGGPPDNFTAIKRVRLATQAVSTGGRNYATTPASCPSGGWRSTHTFEYRDGRVETVTNDSPCQEPGPPCAGCVPRPDRKPPRVELFGVKRRGCIHRSFVVRARAVDDASGLEAVELTLDGRRLATTRRSRLSVRLRPARLRPGEHRLVASARDRAGNSRQRAVSFRPCGR